MHHILLGLAVMIAAVCLGLAYTWYQSQGATDRRLVRQSREEYLAAHRRELFEAQLDVVRDPEIANSGHPSGPIQQDTQRGDQKSSPA